MVFSIELLKSTWQIVAGARPVELTSGSPPICLQTLEDRVLYDASPLAAYAADIGFDIVRWDQSSDGIEQITELLDGRQRNDAIHIVSHGSDGRLQLGNTEFSSENLREYESQLAGWTMGLALGADILMYGCDVAETGIGQNFVEQFSMLVGADVAASDDVTGNADLGGDWEFEYFVGTVETQLAFSLDVQASWMGLLDEETSGDQVATGVIDDSLLETTDDDHSPVSLVYWVTTPPGNGTLLVSGVPMLTFTQDDIDNGRVTYLHNGSETTNDTFDFTVDDGVGAASPGTFVITINPVNDAPVANDDAIGLNEGGTYIGPIADTLGNDTDAEFDPLTASLVTGPSNGTLVLNPDGSFTYTHAQ